MTDPRPGGKVLLLSHTAPTARSPRVWTHLGHEQCLGFLQGMGPGWRQPPPLLTLTVVPWDLLSPRAKMGVGQPPQSILGFAMPTTTPAEPHLRHLGGRQFPGLGKVGLEPS